MGMTKAQFADLARAQVGDAYRLGAETLPTDPDPETFDCSELVQWLYARAGFPITDLAYLQYNATAPATGSPDTGDLVFLRNNLLRPNGIGHVAVVTAKLADGDWEVIEAKGRDYGVIKTTLSVWRAKGTYAGMRRYAKLALLGTTPGVTTPVVSAATQYAYPGTVLRLRWPRMTGAAVKRYQTIMDLLGWAIDVDGIYGPRSAGVCKAFQRAEKLTVDGQAGPKTWARMVEALYR